MIVGGRAAEENEDHCDDEPQREQQRFLNVEDTVAYRQPERS